MTETKFNYAYVLCIIVLLFFSYITFLGLAYWSGGSMLSPVLLTLALIVVVGGCVYAMSVARSTRWTDIGLAGQVCFGVVVLAALLAASIPFTNFLRVAGEKEQLKAQMVETVKSSEELDKAYEKYVRKRLSDYQVSVNSIAINASSNPTKYAEIFGTTPAKDAAAKVPAIVESLKDKLMPEGAEGIMAERQKWLSQASELNVWNPMTAANIAKLNEQVDSWDANYKQLSSVIYAGENAKPFEYNDFKNSFQKLTETYQSFRKPNGTAIIISIVCFLVMLFPYFIAQGSLAAKKSSRNPQVYE